jgi:SAM-dependent methyltransferase
MVLSAGGAAGGRDPAEGGVAALPGNIAPQMSVPLRAAPFLAATVLGAFLLFAVQPLAGKYALPWFGGAPQVWATCLVFFQVAVLAGYAWASASLARLSPRGQALAQVALLAAAGCCLPLAPVAAWADGEGHPALRLLGLLGGALGAPCLALATTAPLLQGWYLRVVGRDPYPLYALSNLGSFAALAAYPLLFEPLLARSQQAWAWSIGFGLWALLVARCAWMAARAPLARAPLATVGAPRPSRGVTARWLLLPALGSALLTATSNALCQDDAPVPFLWLLPLALYLLSWVLAFAGPRGYPRRPVIAAAALGALAVLAVGQAALIVPLAVQVAVHAAALGAACWFCHGELARLRPHPAGLGQFYLIGAVGGALGSAAVVFLAPLVFATNLEQRLLLLAVLGLAAASTAGAPRRIPRWATIVAAPAAVAVLLATQTASRRIDRVVAAERTFFGALSVREHDRGDPRAHRRELRHGATVHGVQLLAASRRRAATAYYAPSSGVGLALSAPGPARRVGVVGLGAGTLATYGRPGDTVRFYEIDPAVERLARTWFSFLADSPARVEVVIGDARRSLAVEPDQGFDVLVLDAFSSDAVPAHLLTREAFELYRRHLAPRGLVAVHVSNRHLDLEPVVRAAVARLDWPLLAIEDEAEEEERPWVEDSTWLLAGPDRRRFLDAGWRARASPEPFPPRQVPWTDERADLLGILK